MNKAYSFLVSFFILLSITLYAKCAKTGFPKWDGIITLQEARLPVLHAIFLEPYSDKISAEKALIAFLAQSKAPFIALRPDGKGGIGQTPPGIGFKNTDQELALNKLVEWSQQGFGITIIEGYNRFGYEFCCNILLLDEDGNFLIEFVGPGFDGGDLNKGLLQPTILVTNKENSPIFIYSEPISGEANIETLDRLFFRINIQKRNPTTAEIATRLAYITTRLLPDMGIKHQTIEATKQWLIENDCTGLLQNQTHSFLSLDDLKKIIFFASRYAHTFVQKGEKIAAKALTVHKVANKIFFFGTYDAHKWGRAYQNSACL